MPAPTNTSALTAIDIGTTLPYSNSQRVDDSGVTYTVWYSYTPQTGVYELGVWGLGDLTVYKPSLLIYSGPASAPVNILTTISAQNIPVQIPVTPGVQIFFQFLTNAGNPTPANLAVSIIAGPTSAVPIGSIVVPDDNIDFPTAFLSPSVNFTVLNFAQAILSCEAGDTLDNGTFLTDSSLTADLSYYTSGFTRSNITWPTASDGTTNIRTCKGAQNFYLADPGSSFLSIHASIYKVSAAGVLSTVAANLGVFGADRIAATNDETKVYLTGCGVSTIGSPVFTWNVAGAAFGANFVAGVANYQVFDILVLSDNTVVIGYVKTSVTRDIIIKIYSSVAVLLQTISYGSDIGSVDPHLAYALDDPTSFWFWVHLSSTNGESNHIKYTTATGAVALTRRNVEYELGQYVETVTLTPVARFGNSNSCPFWILRGAAVPVTDHSGIYTLTSDDPGTDFPARTNDKLFANAGTTDTIQVKIPDPTARMYPLGD